ncbi:MAG: hypothetical protein PF487_10085 [Bacteroidales bacterium]|nr:hypothetical protein [Bacteroidales bacterium]
MYYDESMMFSPSVIVNRRFFTTFKIGVGVEYNYFTNCNILDIYDNSDFSGLSAKLELSWGYF